MEAGGVFTDLSVECVAGGQKAFMDHSYACIHILVSAS